MCAVNATSPAMNQEYAGDAPTLRAARLDVADFLLGFGASTQTVEQASLVVSELASNAIQVAPGLPYHVSIRIVEPNAVALSVRNCGLGSVPPARGKWRPIDELSSRGRGLSIVDAVSDEVTVELDGDEVTVTAWFRLIIS